MGLSCACVVAGWSERHFARKLFSFGGFRGESEENPVHLARTFRSLAGFSDDEITDLVDTAASPIVDLSAAGSSQSWVALTTHHENGAVGQMSLSLSVGVADGVFECTLYGPDGVVHLAPPDPPVDEGTATMDTIRAEFAAMVGSGTSHPLDVERGVRLQELIERAARQLAA